MISKFNYCFWTRLKTYSTNEVLFHSGIFPTLYYTNHCMKLPTQFCKITTMTMVIVILNYFILVPTRYKYKKLLAPGHSAVYITTEEVTYVFQCLPVKVPHYLMRPSISTLQIHYCCKIFLKSVKYFYNLATKICI